MKRIILSFISFLIIQNTYANDWFQVEGKYAKVEYQQSNKIIADSLLEIAELSIPRLAKIFGIPVIELEKSKVRIILTDAPDVTNGYALADAVIIYALSSMYMDMVTGTQTWYSHVLKHELAHYLTFIKIKRKLNFLGEIASLSVPRWFYEGIAQYYTENWNTYRGDIYVRNAVLSGKFTYSALNNMKDGKLLYAGAHSFTRYLADQYGDSSLVRVMDHNKKGWLYDFDQAFEKVYKKNPERLFTDFIRHCVIYYGDLLAEYPVSKLSEKLLPYGYRTLQVLPLSTDDSTYIMVSQKNEIHRYKTASLVQYQKGKIRTIKTITNHLNTDVFLSHDKKLAAFGSYYYSRQSNQINLKYLWKIYNLETEKTQTVTEAIRAREAVFDKDNNLILCEVQADQSILYRFNLVEETREIILKTKMPIGGLACLPDNRLVLSAQQNNGFRDLFLYSDSALRTLTNDAEDDRNPIIINDSLIVFNRYIDNNPALAVYNLNAKTVRTILNDQYPYWLHGYDNNSGKLITSTWDAERHGEFAQLPMDSIYNHNIQPDTIIQKDKYASWIFRSPQAADMLHLPDTTIQNLNRRPLTFPQFALVHLFSIAIPLYDPDLGIGLFGITSWLEAMQRQALAAMFVGYEKDINQSLVLVSHNLVALNSTFSTSYYHGPVIFSHQNESYIEMNQDIGEIMWSKKFYIKGSNRSKYRTSLAYTGYYYNLGESILNIPDDFGYHGPSIDLGISYLLPTQRYPFLPKRQFKFSLKYFRSLNHQYDFGISEANLTIASNLFSESLGFNTRLTAINKQGTLPALKTIGIDRFYEYDFPRDFKYTRPLRGIRKDLESDRLYWSSTELTYFLSEYTGLILLFLPIDNLSIKGFVDYASLGQGKDNQAYSYGGEVSFGRSLYRAGFGLAEGSYAGIKTEQEYYIRFSLYIPER